MTTVNPAYLYHSIPLEHGTVAVLQMPNLGAADNQYRRGRYFLRIITASCTDDGAHSPAESITLGTEGIEQLRQLLLEKIEDPAGIDHSIGLLTVLAEKGVTIRVSVPTDMEKGQKPEEAIRGAMKIFGSAGFNITTESRQQTGFLEFIASPLKV
jgi:hypothetical protein